MDMEMQPKGFTQVPNDILEVLIRIVNGPASSCAFFLLRKTLGYQKITDMLSNSQISKATGLNVRTVMRAMRKLSDLNIAILIKKGSNKTSCNEWKFNTDISSWTLHQNKSLVPKVSLVPKIAMTTDKNGQQLVSELSPTIESNTKETIQKKVLNIFFENFWNMYPNKKGKQKAMIAWNKLTEKEKSLAMVSLPSHISCDEWQKSDGQFIPHPATWLNQHRWEDEIKPKKIPNSLLGNKSLTF